LIEVAKPAAQVPRPLSREETMTTIKLTNTATRTKEVFTPLDPADVRMYVCGPTVYDRAHLGNARPVVVFDVLYRLLRHVYGADHVTYVRNFTDVDDKIIKRADETGQPIDKITSETTQWFLEDMGELGALEPSIKGDPDHAKAMPRATQYIPQMVAMIADLIEKGHAYAAEGHVLFAVDSWREKYGRLSGRSVDDMIAGARVEVAPYKRNPMDFVLWKPAQEGEPGWDSPWGRGRPGWHIECSAMSHELLGESFDIHGGGNDLMFPHHENEIAQSCCAHPEGQFARYWLHNEMLQVEGRKMSKSLGNFFTVRDLLDGNWSGGWKVPGEVIRFVFLQTHYRKPMDWTAEKAREAARQIDFWANEIGPSHWIIQEFRSDPTGFSRAYADRELVEALCEDLNTALALSSLQRLTKQLHYPARARLTSDELDTVLRRLLAGAYLLGLDLAGFYERSLQTGHDLSAFGEMFEGVRENAKQTKDFTEVDRLKAALIDAGVEVRMGKQGVDLVPGPDFDPKKLEALK
jgi:cysteinyl-tRNA synthetase